MGTSVMTANDCYYILCLVTHDRDDILSSFSYLRTILRCILRGALSGYPKNPLLQSKNIFIVKTCFKEYGVVHTGLVNGIPTGLVNGKFIQFIFVMKGIFYLLHYF